MKKLSLLDDAFLWFESRRIPLNIGVLMLLEPPAGSGIDFAAKIAERLRESSRAAPPFNYRPARRGALYYWEEDEEFDLDHHFAHTALPQPGRVRELLAMVSRLHSGHLDREYPLWRMHLIEGLPDGRIALYMKTHHALVDGMAGMRMLLKSMAPSAEASRKLPPPWEVQTQRSGGQALPVPTPAADSLPALGKLVGGGWNSVSQVVRELRGTWEDHRSGNPDLALFGDAPQTLFNQKVSATRRFAAQSYSTGRIRAVAAAHEATVNDVVLAMCAGALRRYLDDMHELPAESLMAAVPISLRRPGSDAGGNEVAFTVTTLATAHSDPVERMRAIKRGMDYNKARLRKLTPGQVMGYTAALMIPGHLAQMLRLTSDDKTLANVVISHVPGPRQDLYWQGARLAGMYPISLNIDGAALNITLVSRHDYVDIGLIACRRSVPRVQRLLDDLEEALAELERASGIPSRKARSGRAARRTPAARGKAAARNKAAPAKKSAAGKKAVPAKKAAPGKKTTAGKKAAPAKKAAPGKKTTAGKQATRAKRAAPAKKAAAGKQVAARKKTAGKAAKTSAAGARGRAG